ncbi:MAG: biotin--[acetyl-CoA-carboxylase] ligase [Flavobacteriaceae bacterium]|nr:biotin--[acetyl-CoA-carboxylase] ligase [Flavobacteriaceae bacterium]
MNIIKLSAIDSTNEFLKRLKRETHIVDFTVVTADFQTKGKGQMGSEWNSESGKNLMVSVLKKLNNLNASMQFNISLAISIAVFKTIYFYIPNKLSIKWPNDILSDGHKVAGILIENTITDSKITDTIIGIGINVNQLIFSSEIHKATSLKLKLKLNTDVDRDVLLEKLLKNIEIELLKVTNNNFINLKEEYLKFLYKKGIPTMFEDSRNRKFLGLINDVSDLGELIVELENGQIQLYNLKEIRFL